MSRRWVLGWVLSVFLFTPLAQAQIPYSSQTLPTRTSLARLGLERHWMAVVPLLRTERLIEISISGNLLFAQTNQGNFFTYNAESGQLLWRTSLGPQTTDVQPASVNSTLVFVTNAHMLFALDRQTGRTVWTEDLHVLPSTATMCDEDRVMVGLETGMIRGFNLKYKDTNGVEHASPKAIFAWNWQTNGPVASRPQPAGRLAAFCSRDGRLYVAMAEQAKMIYRLSTGGGVFAPMGVYGSRVMLIPSADQNVYAIDLFTAESLWTLSTGAPVLQEPMVTDQDVYLINRSGVLNGVNVQNGEPRWSTATHGGRLIAVSGSKIYLESADRDLFVVDRATGRMVADPRTTYNRAGLNLRDFELSPVNNLNDRIYLGAKAGVVIALREVGQRQPRLLRDPKEKPFGYIPPEGLKDLPAPASLSEPKIDVEPAGENAGEAKPAEEGDKEMPKDEAAPK